LSFHLYFRDFREFDETMNDYAVNSNFSKKTSCDLFDPAEYGTVRSFYSDRGQFPPTPLVRLRALARLLNMREILLKDESTRFGLAAFKLLGVRYAVERLQQTGRLARRPLLVCATDGNHGRAVAHVAPQYGCTARIYVPGYTVPARISAIRNEGAEVVVVESSYDDAVAEAAAFAARHGAEVVSDTSWPGYEEIPRWIMAGYTQIMNEVQEQWGRDGPPDIVLVQVGVGGLAAAVVSWLCHYYGDKKPFIVTCEPIGAPCLLESIREQRLVQLQGDLTTIMAGLRCGLVSMIAWPVLSSGVNACMAIDDQFAESAMNILARPSGQDAAVIAGESGACGLAALLAILRNQEFAAVREAAGFGPNSRVLLFNTEGATDPELYNRVLKK
jgi:diaminopropionate ammonia-lyase